MSTLPRLLMLIASTRPGRVGKPIGDWVAGQVEERKDFELDLVDLRALGLPFFDELEHPRTGTYTNAHTQSWSERVLRADAALFVTPEYNHGYPATLKNALDFLHREWRDMPVLSVAYGGPAGGARGVQAIEPVLVALQMRPLPQAVLIPNVAQMIRPDGSFEPTDGVASSARRGLDHLAESVRRLCPV